MAINSAGYASKFLSAYRGLALITLNTVAVFVVLNLIATWIQGPVAEREVAGSIAYGLGRLQQVYPGRSPDEIADLLSETWSRSYTYEPYTQFKEGEVRGDFVNVGADGFREIGHGLGWPPAASATAVFVFGGSTTFGYGVADDETIPARLHRAVEKRCGAGFPVYNLARSNYFSTQENVLFQRLLARGAQPAMAIFVDGLNEFGHPEDDPKFTLRLEYLMGETKPQLARRLLAGLPLARLAKRILARPDVQQSRGADPAEAGRIVERWLGNRRQIRAVARDAGVETLFVWQPVPTYGYDLNHHPFAGDLHAGLGAGAQGYEIVEALWREPNGPLSEDFLWLGDLQRLRQEPLYVDKVHYTAAFSAEIAGRIAGVVAARLCPAPETGGLG